MIDLHTHILPDMDDGANDPSESMAMYKESVRQGVCTVAATPHCRVHSSGDIESFLQRRNDSYCKIKDMLDNELLLGAEVCLDNDITQYGDIGKLCISGTNLLLAEFSQLVDCRRACEWLYELSVKGIAPIVAHIDRYHIRLEIIENLEGIGITYQINASRFLEPFYRKKISDLINTGERFIVSSDMHNTQQRPCLMESAYNVSVKWFGKKLTGELFEKNSEMILQKYRIK